MGELSEQFKIGDIQREPHANAGFPQGAALVLRFLSSNARFKGVNLAPKEKVLAEPGNEM